MQQYPKHPAGDTVGTAGLQEKAGRDQQPHSSRERHRIQSARGHSVSSVRCLRPLLLIAPAGCRGGRIQPAPHTYTLLMECPLYPPHAQEPLQPPSLQGLPKGPQQGLWAWQVQWAHSNQGCRPRPGKCSKNRNCHPEEANSGIVWEGRPAGLQREGSARMAITEERGPAGLFGAAEGRKAEKLEPWLIRAQ